jgi:hypothetical protein
MATHLIKSIKPIPLQAWTGPEGSREAEAPRFFKTIKLKYAINIFRKVSLNFFPF